MSTIYQQVQPVCPIVFGVDTLEELPSYIKSYHGTRVFCICDPGIRSTTIIDSLTSSLQNQGIFYTIFDKVVPDAPDHIINAAALEARNSHSDLVIGIGGGSSMDTAKAVTVLLENPGNISDYYVKPATEFSTRLPLILLPTSSGTGSEVTGLCVIHDTKTNTKIPVYRSANLAIVDPKLTLSAPPAVTAASAFDAMSHALEAYTSKYHTDKVDTLALQAIQLIAENIITAYQDGTDITARENLAFASNIAGIAFNEVSVHIGHAIAHELGLQFHLSHGVACALTLTTVVHDIFSVDPTRGITIATIFGYNPTLNNESPENYLQTKIHNLLVATHIPSLSTRGITLEQALACATGAIQNNGFLDASPVKITKTHMEHAIRFMYEDYI